MASKGKDNKKKNEKVENKNDDPLGYIPPDLCEFIQNKAKEEEPPPNTIDDAQKKKFLKQIGELQQRAERYARQVDELTLNLTLYPPKFEKIEADTVDISKYLTDILEEKEDEYREKNEIKEKVEEELRVQREDHQQKLDGLKKDLEDLKNELVPENQRMKEQLEEMGEVEASRAQMEAIIDNYREHLMQKALKHHAEMYEREKETVRELFEIRELIPTWVKRVADENKIREKNRIHNILNIYRLELSDLLKKYIGRPNQLARKAIYENEQLKIVMDRQDLKIKLIKENMEAMKRRGESDIHEMHDLASNVKENKILLKSIESNPYISIKNTNVLRRQVLESEILLDKSREYFENLRKEMIEVVSNIHKLDDANFKLQGIIRSFQDALHKILGDRPEYEKLLGNLRVASCLEILDKKNNTFSQQVCCTLVDPYKIFQTAPVTGPKTN